MTCYGNLFMENSKKLLEVGCQLVEATGGKTSKRGKIKYSFSKESEVSDPATPKKTIYKDIPIKG